jgi:hypothetical protein
MLHREHDRTYFVYPSWAELSYSWEALPELLADPFNTRYFRENPNYRRGDFLARGYPAKIQPFELISGPAGGGIVKAQIRPGEKWLPGIILGQEANLVDVTAMRGLPEHLDPQVYYLEPMDQPGWELGLGKKKRVYLCHATTEHADTTEAVVYWVIATARAKVRFKAIEEVPAVAQGFGLQAAPITIPEQLRRETATWLANPDYDYSWFQIAGGGAGLGFHFAVVVYIGFHLRKVVGKRMNSMHLVGDIEGKPQVRIHWLKK